MMNDYLKLFRDFFKIFFTNVLVKNIFLLLADNCKQHGIFITLSQSVCKSVIKIPLIIYIIF